MGRVEGKVALVTGAASGLGLADARRLAEEGASVVLTDINEAGQAAADQIAADTGAKTLFLRQDVSDPDRWKDVVAETEAAFGGCVCVCVCKWVGGCDSVCF